MTDLRAQLREIFQGRVCLVGVGQPETGDDAFGVRLAEALAAARTERSRDHEPFVVRPSGRLRASGQAAKPENGLKDVDAHEPQGGRDASPRRPLPRRTARQAVPTGVRSTTICAWEIIVAGAFPERWLGHLTDAGFDQIVFLDALQFAAEPGSVALLDSTEMESRLPQVSTHRLSLGLLARLIEGGGRTKAWLLGVQPESLVRQQGLSPTVQASVEGLADLMLELVAAPNSAASVQLGVEFPLTPALSPGEREKASRRRDERKAPHAVEATVC